jgi:Flp pilus assembly protein TadB
MPRVPVAILAGGLFGGAVWLLLAALTGHVDLTAVRVRRWRRHVGSRGGKRLLAAAVAGVAVLVATRWVAVSAAVAAAVALWPRLFGAAAEQEQLIGRLEAFATWVEGLRDTIATGLALPEAIPATAETAPQVIQRPLQDLVARMRAREPLDRALLAFADDLDDAVADQAIAALVLNSRAQGRQLKTVLSTLAEATRRQVEVRRAVESERRGPRRGVKITMVVTMVFIVGLPLTNHGYVAAFATPVGQLVLAVDVALFVAAFAWLRRLATFQAPSRLLATPMVRQQRAAAGAAGQPRGVSGWVLYGTAWRPTVQS